MLRRFDSNKRPLGYEPNELPTAPLRDVCDCKGTAYIWKNKLLTNFFLSMVQKLTKAKKNNPLYRQDDRISNH
jgi:hypothetical protein